MNETKNPSHNPRWQIIRPRSKNFYAQKEYIAGKKHKDIAKWKQQKIPKVLT